MKKKYIKAKNKQGFQYLLFNILFIQNCTEKLDISCKISEDVEVEAGSVE